MRRELNDKSKKRRKGFTLTEVLVASSILAFAMVPVLKGLASVHLTSTVIERKTKSLSYAQMKLEEIKARSVYNYASSMLASNALAGENYLCNISDSSAGTDLRDISVSVGFDEDSDSVLDSDEIDVTLQTSLARRW